MLKFVKITLFSVFDNVMKHCDSRMTYFCHKFFYVEEANAPDDMYIDEYDNDGTSRPSLKLQTLLTLP